MKNHSTVVYLSESGERREEAITRIDHLVHVTDGGTNDAANLVISCYPCNQEREVRTLDYNRPFARRRVPCEECGGRLFHPDCGGCSTCGSSSYSSLNQPASPASTSSSHSSENKKSSPGWIDRIIDFLEALRRAKKRLLD